MNASSVAQGGAGAALSAHANEVMQDWLREVRLALPALRAQEEATVRNNMPAFLERLAHALASGGDAMEICAGVCREHGRQRAHLAGARLADVLVEYRLLRRTILRALERRGPLQPAARDAVLDALHEGMTAAGEEFAAAHLEREATLKQALGRSLEQRDEYLSITMHELRTPISTIVLGLDILQKTAERQRTLEAGAIARLLEGPMRQLRRLVGMVNTLLDVARLENGAVLLAPARHDLCAIVRDVAARLAELAHQRGADIELGECPPLAGRWDRDRLEQVLTNLIANAIKYAGPHAVRVSVERAPAEGWARVTVADRGPGIAPADRERVFNRYVRLESDQPQEGLGLGLYIAREIVRAHGGRLRVEDAPGGGAAFVVELPLEREAPG